MTGGAQVKGFHIMRQILQDYIDSGDESLRRLLTTEELRTVERDNLKPAPKRRAKKAKPSDESEAPEAAKGDDD